MSEEKKNQNEKINIPQPDINRSYDWEGSVRETFNYPDRGDLGAGYQPIRDEGSTPPDGGSGVPDKKGD